MIKTDGPRVAESNIDGPFFGWSGSTVFKLANGQLWEQDGSARTHHFAYRPNLTIIEVNDTHVMEVDGVGSIRVRRVYDFIESRIDGAFNGSWDGKTVFRLVDGQVWQQSVYAYHYQHACRPEVLIYLSKGGWKLKVESVHETISVTRIK